MINELNYLYTSSRLDSCEDNWVDYALKVVILSESPLTKGNSELKDFIINTAANPIALLIITNTWNERNPGKMIPNSLRRAMKYLLENMYTFEVLWNLTDYNNLNIKNIIRLCRPKSVNSVDINYDEAKSLYERGYTILSDNISYNKFLLNVEFEQLNIKNNQFYHYDTFKILLDNI
jgi:hypothetical protein